jgi:hypothetical protein
VQRSYRGRDANAHAADGPEQACDLHVSSKFSNG